MEVVCRELKRVTKSLLSEFQLVSTNWKSTLTLVQGALNNTILKRLSNNCPLTLFTGHVRDSPVPAIVTKTDGVTQVHNIEQARFEAIANVMKLHDGLSNMHRRCAESTDLRRKQAIKSHNAKTGVRPVNFATGDYVLRGDAKRGQKLQLTWKGPYRVTKCLSEYLFEVDDLLTGERKVVHGRRLKHFRNSDFKITEKELHHLEYQRGELLVIESFEDIRETNGQTECLIKWKGFGDDECDWVPTETLREDVPDLYKSFLEDIQKKWYQESKKNCHPSTLTNKFVGQ